MGTLKGGYKLKDGTRVPSVTTILHSWHPEGIEGLLGWANKLGREGKSHKEERDSAAAAGTMAHEAAEAWAHGREFKFEGPEEVCAKAKISYGAFLEWTNQTQFKVTDTELPLVSEKYRFAGTFDCMLMKGKRVLGDIKTSNSLQPTYLCQIAAYGKLWEENFPDKPIDGGYILLRFDRTYGDFSQKWWPGLDAAWRAFLHLRGLYDEAKELRARIK